MTTADFLAAVAKYADDVAADHVVIVTARGRKTLDGLVTGEWIAQPPAARVHRTAYLPYIARTRIAANLGLVVVPDAMTEHVSPIEWEMG